MFSKKKKNWNVVQNEFDIELLYTRIVFLLEISGYILLNMNPLDQQERFGSL
jgi:hypothetical protein